MCFPQAVAINTLLKVYGAIDRRAKVLGFAFRYWAKVRKFGVVYMDSCTIWPYGRMCVAPYCIAAN